MATFDDSIRGTGGIGRPLLILMTEFLGQNSTLTDYRQYFPEAFLWDVFYYQVEAAAAMVNGPADANWEFEEIVHRDIKPGNGTCFPQYHPLTR